MLAEILMFGLLGGGLVVVAIPLFGEMAAVGLFVVYVLVMVGLVILHVLVRVPGSNFKHSQPYSGPEAFVARQIECLNQQHADESHPPTAYLISGEYWRPDGTPALTPAQEADKRGR